MSSWELYLPPVLSGNNARTGRYKKGHVPHNKGKKWNEWMSKSAQRKVVASLRANKLGTHPWRRSADCGRARRPVVAVDAEGRFRPFPSLADAGRWVGCSATTVKDCCEANRRCGRGRGSCRGSRGGGGRPSTDHALRGWRFYYEADSRLWGGKVRG